MARRRAHTTAKAADVIKLLLPNKRRVTDPPVRSMAVLPPSLNPNPTLTLTLPNANPTFTLTLTNVI